MENRITKKTKVKDAEEILTANGISLSTYSMMMLGMLLQNCDYIEIEGYGHSANLKLVTE